MRTLRDLTPCEIENILQDSSGNCYSIVARKHDICINTVKRIVRAHARQTQKKEDRRGV